MTPEKILDWVELFGSASALAAIAHCRKDGKDAAANFTATAELALAKVREGLTARIALDGA